MKRNTKSDELEWCAVTTLADGSQEMKWYGQPVKSYRSPIFSRSSIFYHTEKKEHPYLRDARRMREAHERAVKKEERLEKERIERIKHLLELKRAVFLRRLVRLTIRRMASAIFQTAGQIIKQRELRMAFREFLADIQYDAIFNNTENLEE